MEDRTQAKEQEMSASLDSLTIGEARQLAMMFAGGAHPASHPYVVGKLYLIRTVTHYHVGELVGVYEHELLLRDAAWVADTGRFAAALESGDLSEVEPFHDEHAIIGRGSIVDATPWSHDPLRKVIG
jgi:hypothetical protein